MKLAECLLQDRPIRRVGQMSWVTPIVHQDNSGCLYLKHNENYLFYLTNDSFNSNDWEIRPMTLGEKILEIMKDHTRSAEKALCDIRYVIESGSYKE